MASDLPVAPDSVIAAGDRVIAFDGEAGHKWLLQLDGGGARKIKGLGVVDPGRLAGTPWGASVAMGAKTVTLWPPRTPDLVATLRRKAQIIQPKDGARILFELGASPGDHILESGIGSGALTIPLAKAVGPSGHITVQELREDFRDWAMDNVTAAGLNDRVTCVIGDLTQSVADGVDGPFHGCVLDQPEPWKAIPHVAPTLLPGGALVAYTPQVSQMEATYRALVEAGFHDPSCIELTERAWEVKERGSRPTSTGILHTAFLVTGRAPGTANDPQASGQEPVA